MTSNLTITVQGICCASLLSLSALSSTAQSTILAENMGTPASASVAIAGHAFQNSGAFGFSGTGTADVSNATSSNGYPGASGGGNINYNGSGAGAFRIDGINTVGFSTITLSFGAYKSTLSSTIADRLTVEFSVDNGASWSQLIFPDQPIGTGTSVWRRITVTGGAPIPSVSNLSLRFSRSSTAVDIRIDDILLSGTATGSLLVSNPNALVFGSVELGASSATQSLFVSGFALTPATGSIIVDAPSGFEVSLDGIVWSAQVLVPYASGELNVSPVRVRFSPQSLGQQNGVLTISGGSATNVQVALTGLGSSAPAEVIYFHSFDAGPYVHPYTVAPNTLAPNLTGSSWTNSAGTWSNTGGVLEPSNSNGTTVTLGLSIASGYTVDITSFSFWRERENTVAPEFWSMSINGIQVGAGSIPVNGANTGPLLVQQPVAGLTGSFQVVLTLSSGSSVRYVRLDDVRLEGVVAPIPSLVASPGSLAFGDVPVGSSSASQSFQVSAQGFAPAAGNLTVQVPNGSDFALGLSGTGPWSTTVQVPYTGGTLPATTVHVRFSPTVLGPQTVEVNYLPFSGGPAAEVELTGNGVINSAVQEQDAFSMRAWVGADALVLGSDASISMQVMVLDASGRMVKDPVQIPAHTPRMEISTIGWPSGVYLLIAHSPQGRWTFKMPVVH